MIDFPERRPRPAIAPILPLMILAFSAGPAVAQQGDAVRPDPCSASPDVLAKIGEKMQANGEIELVPWLHGLSAEQAYSATEATTERLVFPKEGNAWLSCVEEGDVVWSILAPEFDLQFALRVLEVTDETDRVILDTRSEGLHVLMMGLRYRDAEPDPVLARLEDRLPTELPGGLRRSFIESEDPGYSLSYSGVDGGVMLGLNMADEQKLAERRAELKEGVAEYEGITEETRDGRTVYLVNVPGEVSLTTFLDGVAVKLVLLPGGAEMGAEQLQVALDALDLDAIEALAAG